MSLKPKERLLEVESEAAGNQQAPASDSRLKTPNFFAALWRDARLLLIGLWLGATLFFGAAVAPSAFAVLSEARDLAGAIVARTLYAINMSGLLIALVLLASAPLGRDIVRRGALLSEAVALTVVALMTSTGQWVITRRMDVLRAQMRRPIETVAMNDPARVEFGQLHFYSVVVLGVALVAGLAAFFLMARRRAC